jgi:hypothetical protein
MARQDEFKAELFDLLRRYNVEMSVVEEIKGYTTHVTGITFWSYTQHDGEGNEIGEMIDLTVGRWENGKE